MNNNDTATAQARINSRLAEEGAEYGYRYTFADLRDRFEDGLAEAIEDGDDRVCVKVPSFYELSFSIDTVKAALGR